MRLPVFSSGGKAWDPSAVFLHGLEAGQARFLYVVVVVVPEATESNQFVVCPLASEAKALFFVADTPQPLGIVAA